MSGVPSKAASSPAISRVSVLSAAARELGEEPAEDLGERQVRGDRPGRLGRQQRRVDRVPGAAALEHVEDLRRDLLGDQDLGLGGRRPEVRREQRVRRVEERRVGRRLVLEDVDRRRRRGGPTRSASATAASSRTPPRATLRTIEPGLSFAIAVLPMSPRVVRVSGTWTVTTSERRSSSSISTSSTPWLAACSGGHERVDARGPSSPSPGRGPRWPGRSCRGRRCPSVRPRSSRPVNGARFHSPRRTEASAGAVLRASAVEERERVLGGRDRVAGRGVDDRDPGPRRGVEIDVVDADAGPADDDQARARRR